MLFMPKALMESETQTVLFRIWIQVANTISYENNHYANQASFFGKVYKFRMKLVYFILFPKNVGCSIECLGNIANIINWKLKTK